MKVWRLCEILIRQLHTVNTRKLNLLHIWLIVHARTRVSRPIVSENTREQTICKQNRTPNALYPIIILVTYISNCISNYIREHIMSKIIYGQTSE